MMFTGHISNLENPKKFNKNLSEFFNKKKIIKRGRRN